MADADELIALLREAGADRLPHARGRTLLDHLIGTAEIVGRWEQPEHLQLAALLHSAYGTDRFGHAVLDSSRRAEVAAIAGERAERLAHLFGVTPRGPLLKGTHAWARDLPTRDGSPAASREEADELILLHIANLAEQAAAPDRSPAPWLHRVRTLAALIENSKAVALPQFVAGLVDLRSEDESAVIRAYRAGVAGLDDGAARVQSLAWSASACPVLPEPCLWLSRLALAAGDRAAARDWATIGRRRLYALGLAWDKRRTFEEWAALATELIDGCAASPPSPSDDGSGRRRFHRYVESLALDGAGTGRPGVYPELEARPWYEPARFQVARELEAHAEAIQAEILALDGGRFHPESEPIGRSGAWDVAFLYERGRRHDATCAALPVTTKVIEGETTIRTTPGLIYVSRLRPHTHIAAHRGPHNLRLRCHLGIAIPDGDCAIRVGNETRRWRSGAALVFDDFCEHEAWNHTDEDRIVLIVDLWHPGLSAVELRLLDGLHRHQAAQARRLTRYFATNARARAPD
jgi:aspartate beta-hydroxylase